MVIIALSALCVIQAFSIDYFISREYVDQFAHECKCEVKKPDNQGVSDTLFIYSDVKLI